MPKAIKKPIEIEYHQWFKNGDHPEDNQQWIEAINGPKFLSEGKLVRYYRHPAMDGHAKCEQCSEVMHEHGWIDTLEGGHIVCVGDYIIKGIKGEFYPCKPDIFLATYDLIE